MVTALSVTIEIVFGLFPPNLYAYLIQAKAIYFRGWDLASNTRCDSEQWNALYLICECCEQLITETKSKSKFNSCSSSSSNCNCTKAIQVCHSVSAQRQAFRIRISFGCWRVDLVGCPLNVLWCALLRFQLQFFSLRQRKALAGTSQVTPGQCQARLKNLGKLIFTAIEAAALVCVSLFVCECVYLVVCVCALQLLINWILYHISSSDFDALLFFALNKKPESHF